MSLMSWVKLWTMGLCVNGARKHPTPEVARSVYAISTAAADARLAKILYDEIMGEPVEFPTEQELAQFSMDAAAITEVGASIAETAWEVEDDLDPDDRIFQLVAVEDGFAASQEFEESVTSTEIVACEQPSSPPHREHHDVMSPAAKSFLEKVSPVKSPKEVLDEGIKSGKLEASTTLTGIARYLTQCGKHLLTEAEKNYIVAKTPRGTKGQLFYPGKIALQAIIEDGKNEGTLNDAVTYEAAKTLIRKAVSRAAKDVAKETKEPTKKKNEKTEKTEKAKKVKKGKKDRGEDID